MGCPPLCMTLNKIETREGMAMDSMTYLEEITTAVKDGIKSHDPVVIGILVGLIIGLLTLVIFVFSRKQNRKRGILLLGTCDSGKTALFTKLVYNKEKQTYTSIAVNKGTYQVKNSTKTLQILDLPGHERIRSQNLEQHRSQTRGVVYVVDSSSVQKDVKEVAEFLYTVLSDRVLSHNALPVLIACNKQDMSFSKGAKVVQLLLEKEMNQLRVTKSAALQRTDDTEINSVFLGKRNKDFSFADLNLVNVSFAECSSLSKDGVEKMSEVEGWLTKIA